MKRRTRTVYEWTAKLLVLSIALVACAPKIYIVDRQTVLEQEAAGEWPQFEKDLISKSVAEGPVPFSQVPVTEHKRRLYNVLNGGLMGTAETEAVKK